MWKGILVAIPVLCLSVMIQTSIIERINLLHGAADLVLLVLTGWALQERVQYAWIWGVMAGMLVGFISGNPWYIYLVSYMMIVGLSRLLARRIWQAPLLAMFSVTLIGTLLILMLTFLIHNLMEISMGFSLSFMQVILPSMLLNLLLSIPVLSIMRDLANRVYPAEVEA
jgi:rod shape-determining protein MreD